MGNISYNKKKEYNASVKQIAILEIAILLLKSGMPPFPTNINRYLKNQSEKTGKPLLVQVATLNKWFRENKEFKAWFGEAISKKILEDDPHYESKKLVFVDRMWKLAMSGTEPHNLRAAEIFAKLTGLYNDAVNVNIDNRQQSVNVGNPLDLKDIISKGLITGKDESKPELLETEDEFNYETFKIEMDAKSGDNGNGKPKKPEN